MLLPGLAAPPIEGAAFMIAAGIAWAGYSLLGRGARDPTAATAGNFLRAVPFAAALSLAVASHTSVDQTGALYAVASGAVTSGLGYVLWYAVLPSLDRHIGRRDPAQRAGDCRVGRRGSAGRAALEPPDDRIRHDPGRDCADHLASPRLMGG